MESLADLLEKVRELGLQSFSKDEAERLFGWKVAALSTRCTERDESHVTIDFDNCYRISIKYFLNLDPTETEDTCEFTLGLKTDLVSRIKYDIHYATYIHGQGYIRLRLQDMKNRTQEMILEEYYTPGLRNVYKPIIMRFCGFFARDFFGVQAGHKGGEIFYAPVRYRSEHKAAKIGDVMGRLSELDLLLKEPSIRHALAEIDLQLSLLPSMVWAGL